MRPDRPGTRYVEAAIQREAETVTTAPAGNRNHQLNRSTWALARFVGEGLTTPASIEHAMMEAAAEAGIAAREAATTIRSALRRASR